MKIKTKLYLGVWVAAALIALFIVTRIISFNAIDKNSARVKLASEIKTAVFELNILLHEYAVNRNEISLKQWESKYGSGLVMLQQKEWEGIKEEGEREILRSMTEDYLSLSRLFRDTAENYADKQKLMSIKSQAVMSSARRLERLAFARLDRAFTLTRNSAYLFSLLMLIIIAVVSYKISSDIAAALHKLHKGTEIVGQGNLDYKICLEGKDEIAQVSCAFDRMTGNLQKTTASRDELEKARAYSEGILSSMMDGFWAINAQGNTIDINQAMVGMLGYESRAELLKKNPAEVTSQKDLATTGKSILEVFGGKNSNLEIDLIRKDDKEITVSIHATGLKDAQGKVTIAFAVMRDITDRKKAELALRESKAWLSAVLKSVGDGMIVTDAAGRVVFLNPVAEALMGWQQAEARGRPLEEIFNIVSEETGQMVENLVGKVIREVTVVGLGNHTILIAKDGTRRPIDVSAAPIIDAKNKCCLGVVLVFRDVTERRKVEDALKKINELKTDFVSMASHELRTPLTIIKQGVALVLDQTAGVINPRQKEFLETADRNISRLTRLINDLLDISKIEAQKMPINIQAVDIVKAMAESVALLKPQADGKKINLAITKFPEKSFKVFADPDRLSEIFQNLISNALKFTGEQGRVSVEIIEREDQGEVKVIDTGRGIAREDLPKLFQKFEQFDRVAGPGSKGTGLGLAITKGLIELQGGKIWAESELGKGSKFTFTIPKA